MIPGEMFGFRFRPDGLDPNSSIFEVLSMRFPIDEDVAQPPIFIPFTRDPESRRRAWGSILHQDFGNLERVQLGLRSGDLDSVRLAGYQEQLIGHLHDVIDDYLDRPLTTGSLEG